jgi:TonB family protein
MAKAFTQLRITTTLILGAIAVPVGAQTGRTEAVFYEAGPWMVTEQKRSRYCRLTRPDLPGGELELSKAEAEPAYFNYELAQRLDYRTPPHGVEWRFDTVSLEGNLLTGHYYQISDRERRNRTQSARAQEHFRQADKLTILHNGKTVVDIDLTGSLKAFDALVRCAAQWPGATVPLAPPSPPPPAPPPPRTNADGRGIGSVLPANSPVKPIDRDKWFATTQEPIYDESFRTERRVGFSVEVNPQGRVESCSITQSSGAPSVDQWACKVISRRARFAPQTNEQGEPVPGRFSSVVVWKHPEPLTEPPEE